MKVVVPFPLGRSERVGYCFKSPKQQVRSSCLVQLTGALSSGGPRPVQEPAGECQRLGGWDGGDGGREVPGLESLSH